MTAPPRRRALPALALAAACAIALSAAPAKAKTISIMVGGIEKQIYLPAMLAQQLGYFKDEGLDVELSNEAAGVEAADAMIAHEVQGAVGFYDHTIDLQGKGKFAESVVQFSRVPGEVELVSSKIAPKVTGFADLKGSSLGVTGLGSSTDFLTRYMAARAGLQPGEITTVAVGAGNTFIAALKQNAIQGGMTTEPTISQVVSTGIGKVLIDMRTEAGTRAALGGTYPAACLYMMDDYVKANPDVAQKLANALVRTMHYIDTHSADDIASHMPKDYYAGDQKMYVSALASGKSMFTPDGKMPADGPKTVLAVMSSFEKTLQAHPVDLSKTYTTQFVDAANATK
jgi:NitT/TauT family transport system substrate-binding protein